MNASHSHRKRRRLLVVALDTAACADLERADVLVVAPAINSRLRHWVSDDDTARRLAQERADALVERLERGGVRAEGRVGDADPLQAVADALHAFPADTIVFAAGAEPAVLLAEELVPRARERFSVPAYRVWSAAERAAGERLAA